MVTAARKLYISTNASIKSIAYIVIPLPIYYIIQYISLWFIGTPVAWDKPLVFILNSMKLNLTKQSPSEELMPEIDWRAKKRNMGRRVDTYSNPGVSEVIYKGEWKHKINSRADNNSNMRIVFLILAGVIIGLILVSIIWK